MDVRALCGKFRGRARTSCGESLRQSMGGVTLSRVCPHCNNFPLDYIWWVSTGHGDGNNRKKRNCSWWCAACGGQYEWRAPNRILVQLGTYANEAKVCKAHAASQGPCDNLTKALMLLANQQKKWRQPDSEHCDGPA